MGRSKWPRALLPLAGSLLAACGSGEETPAAVGGSLSGAAGTTTMGGSADEAASGGTGGAAAGGESAGGAAGNETGGTAGATTTGGAGGGGGAGGEADAAGGAGAEGGAMMSGGAAGGGAGGDGGDGGQLDVMPSSGCGEPSGSPMNADVANAIVTFPQGYDGSSPVPLMFGFHGAGRTHEEFYTVDARTRDSDMERDFVMVYLKAAGDAWAASDSSRFDAAYQQMTQDYCIDLNRVFATGHSSGAHFIETLLCNGEQRLTAVALVAGSKRCDSWDSIPSMLIHGSADQERVGLGDADGEQELGPFVLSNECGASTAPYTEALACNSIYNQASVDNGCVSYESCSQPFVFCRHDDQNYGGTNHGWPCFANQTMHAFLSAL